MVAIDLNLLVLKLNRICREALNEAVGLAHSRGHYNVEIEHWLMKLLDEPNTDLLAIFHEYRVGTDRLTSELNRSLDEFKVGNSRAPALSPSVVSVARDGWLIASVDFTSSATRSGHLLCALLADETVSREVRKSSKELSKISLETLRQNLSSICEDTTEAAGEAATAGSLDSSRAEGMEAVGKGSALDKFTMDLTARAKAGELDPVIGREEEIRQMVDILTRRRQNNPILTGEAGVGKTALAEGLALRIAQGEVPPLLKNVAIRSLDLTLLQAGAGVRGEFENRLKSVIDEVKSSPQSIILFIDEAHTLIGAGAQQGQGDAANILKPALARGELRTIAATTWAEYKEYFEDDAALTRRFQVVKVDEPDEAVAVEIMRGVSKIMEAHHNVRLLDEALIEAVRLSKRYISGRQLPDKAVSLVDTACARVAMGHNTVPPAIEDCRRRINYLSTTFNILRREAASGAENEEELTEVKQEKEKIEAELQALEIRWQQESDLVCKIRELRTRLEEEVTADKTLEDEERDRLKTEMKTLTEQLNDLQGENPLTQVCVDGQAVAEVVSAWTGVPVGRMVTDEIDAVLNLKDHMQQSIVGQSHALDAIAQSIGTARANLTDPRRPIGVFLLVGPSGVGKTETAVVLADLLYGGQQNMTVINMSEFKEEYRVSLLMGSPPGYVGYRKGGVLTEAVRRRPHSIVLLDEMEKSHPDVQDVFYQVFDKGVLRDGQGRDVDFKNTIILMTSNAGSEGVMKLCADPETAPDSEALAEALRPDLLKIFRPAFLGRVTVVPYFPLPDEVLKKIIELQLARIANRVQDNYKAQFSYSPDVVTTIASRCKTVESGARNVDHILSRTLLPQLSAEFLSRMSDQASVNNVNITVDKTEKFCYSIT